MKIKQKLLTFGAFIYILCKVVQKDIQLCPTFKHGIAVLMIKEIIKLSKEILLTQAGYDDLVKELDYLKSEKRAEIAEKIKVARGFGDLSENSEYDEAKNEQGLVEQKINELEYTIKHARLVNKEDMNANGINVGSHVVVVDEDDFEEEYDIVGATEFDPFNNKISLESPIGAALVGKKAGEVAEVILPTGAKMQLTIKSVG